MKIKRGGAGLLLTELLIAVMFFSLTSAICLRLFVSAYESSETSAELSRAIIEAQNVAETFKSVDGDLARVAEILGTGHISPNTDELWLPFNSDWERVDTAEWDYTVLLSITDSSDNTSFATVVVYKNNRQSGSDLTLMKVLFSIDIAALKTD